MTPVVAGAKNEGDQDRNEAEAVRTESGWIALVMGDQAHKDRCIRPGGRDQAGE